MNALKFFRIATVAFAVNFALAMTPVQALYDPKPDDTLAAAQGEWKGTLTYRDYSKPDQFVTLTSRVFVALSGPSEITVQYAYDDGPGKTVYSYERMSFDAAKSQLIWAGGLAATSINTFRVTADASDGGTRTLAFERSTAKGIDRYKFDLNGKAWTLVKDEIDSAGKATLRSRTALTRP
jgi:hypothetical protein